MKILFCNIARMKYYKGIVPGVDEPQYGGEYVAQTGDAHEKFNFSPLQEDDRQKCFGFFETKSTNGASSSQLHIERIEGVPRKAEEAEQVLVIWCSTHHQNESIIVGWYKNATVLRHYEVIGVTAEDGSVYQQAYNVEADAEDCVLLSMGERNRHCWWAPRRKATKYFCFGQANVWFAEEESAENYIQKVIEQINAYGGENWPWKWPGRTLMEIGFIDYSKDERNRILSTLKLLGEQTALDELGIGVIRDAYADLLFPGISTLQTRAK